MDLGLTGRVAAIAAASKGLGFACADALAREGAAVSICARSEDSVRSAAEKIGAHAGARVRAASHDLTRPGECERFVEETVGEFGRLDVLVGNVGGPPAGTLPMVTDDAFRDVLEQNFMVMVRLARAALPHMRAARWGRIVFITSGAVRMPIDGLMAGNSARAGVTAFAKTLSREVAADGITVNCVAPEAIRTDRIESLARQRAELEGIPFEQAIADFERTPMGRAGRPEELGALVAFLASERASFLTGTTIQVDGGQSRALL